MPQARYQGTISHRVWYLSARNRRKEGYFVGVDDNSFVSGGLSIDPRSTGGHQRGEVIAELVARCADDFAHGVSVDRNRALSCGFTDGRKQSKGGHSNAWYRSQRSRPDRFDSRGGHSNHMTEILMVRHGQSEWNALGRWQGQADPPLSPLGLEQAEAGGSYLATLAKETAFDGIASSTLDRAATTGDVIAKHLGFDTPYRTANLAERDAGEWSGMTRPEIDDQYPGFLKAKKYPPGYESDKDLLPRIRRGLREVCDNVAGNRLIVTAHGGIIYCIEASLGKPFRHMANLGALWFDFDAEDKFVLGDRLELLADFSGESTTPNQI